MRALFRALAAAFFVAAMFHVAKAIAREGDVARHVVFVAIDLGVAGLVLARPRWAAIVFTLLVGQQLASHGGDLVRTWRAEHRVDASDVAVLLVMPLTLAALVIDARSRRRAPPPL